MAPAHNHTTYQGGPPTRPPRGAAAPVRPASLHYGQGPNNPRRAPPGAPPLPSPSCGEKGEPEGRAFADRTLSPYAAAVTEHDLPYTGQAYAGAGELAVCMQPLEWLE